MFVNIILEGVIQIILESVDKIIIEGVLKVIIYVRDSSRPSFRSMEGVQKVIKLSRSSSSI